MSKYIDADLYVEMQIYDDEHEEWGIWNGTIEELLDQWTEQGCPSTIEVSDEVLKATKKFNAYTIADENADMGMRTMIEPIIEVSKDCRYTYCSRCGMRVVVDAPSVTTEQSSEVGERKQGCWRKTEHQGETLWKCSECGLIHKYASNYCDSCGADMRGVDRD